MCRGAVGFIASVTAHPDSPHAPPRHHRILHFHQDVPGVLSKINTVMADLGINIAGQHLKTNEDIRQVVLNVAPTSADEITTRLRPIPETIRRLWYHNRNRPLSRRPFFPSSPKGSHAGWL